MIILNRFSLDLECKCILSMMQVMFAFQKAHPTLYFDSMLNLFIDKTTRFGKKKYENKQYNYNSKIWLIDTGK